MELRMNALKTMFAARPAPTTVLRVSVATLALGVAACGGGDTDSSDVSDSPSAGVDGPVDTTTDADAGSGGSDEAPAAGDSMATLTVDGEVYSWTADQSELCLIGETYPVDAEFREAPRGQEGDWFQFLDRGDGGINFSAVLEGQEYSGTGSGEADEIRADGFTYAGTLNRDGENLDVELVVSC